MLSQNTSPILLKDIAIDGSSNAHNLIAFKGKYYYFAQNADCEWTLFQTSLEKGSIPKALKIVQKEDNRLANIEWVIGDNEMFFSSTDVKNTTFWQSDGTEQGTFVLRTVGSLDEIVVPKTFKRAKNNYFYFTKFKNDTVKLWSLNSLLPIVVGNASELNVGKTYVHDSLLFFVQKNRLWSVDGLKTKSLANFIPEIYDNGKFYGVRFVQTQQSSGTYDIATGKTIKYWDNPVKWLKFNNSVLFIPHSPDTSGFFKIVGNQVEQFYTGKITSFVGQMEDKFYFYAEKVLWETDGTSANTKKYTGKLDIGEIVSNTVLKLGETYFLKEKNANDYTLIRLNINTNERDTLIKNGYFNDFILKNQDLFFIEEGSYPFWYFDRAEIMSIDMNTLKKTPFYQHNFNNKSARPSGLISTEKYIYFHAADTSYLKKTWWTDGTTQGTVPFIVDYQSESLGLVIGQYKENICFYNDYSHNLYLVNEKTKKVVYKYQKTKGDWITPKFYNQVVYVLEENNKAGQLVALDLENKQQKIVIDAQTNISHDFIPTSKGVFFYAADTAFKYHFYFFDGTKSTEITTERPSKLTLKDNKCTLDEEGNLYFVNVNYKNQDSTRITLWKTDGTNIGTTALLGTKQLPWFKYFNEYSIYKTNKHLYLWCDDYNNKMTRINLVTNEIKTWDDLNMDNFAFLHDAFYTTTDKFIFWGAGFSCWVLDDAEEQPQILLDEIDRAPLTREIIIYQDKIYFVLYSYDYNEGDLWVTDGTKAGTKMLFKSTGGVRSKAPTQLNRIGDKLIFAYDEGCTGEELYYFPLPTVDSKEKTENALAVQISVFPNPTNGAVHIYNLDQETESQINILDLNGKVLQQFTCHSSNYKLDLQDLQNGIYLISVKNGTNSQNAKIVLLK